MEPSKLRKPVVAGQFYPGSASSLRREIAAFVDKQAKKQAVVACMLPHAGYMYSGNVAVKTVSHINLRDQVILLGPNHTGDGAEFSIMADGAWQTPLGEVKIERSLASRILKHNSCVEDNPAAHLGEHSLEVQLPILQYFKSDFTFVPLTIMSQGFARLKQVGKGIAAAIKDLHAEDSTLLVASSDMTHYEPQAEAQKKDAAAIEAILELDEDKLKQRVEGLNISMCGYAPVVCLLSCIKELGVKQGRLIAYQTSGDVTGDKTSVVGYAGIIFY